jgi:hypothetical protein
MTQELILRNESSLSMQDAMTLAIKAIDKCNGNIPIWKWNYLEFRVNNNTIGIAIGLTPSKKIKVQVWQAFPF